MRDFKLLTKYANYNRYLYLLGLIRDTQNKDWVFVNNWIYNDLARKDNRAYKDNG